MTRFIWFNKLLRQAYRSLPLPWHIKQWAKSIYLGRPFTWKKSDKNPPLLDKNREPLSLLATSARQFDPADPWVLVFDSGASALDPAFGSIRMTMILRALGTMGFQITFVSDSGRCLHDYEEILEKKGMRVLSGFRTAHHHLATEGGKYHFVLLSGVETTFRYLPYIRAYAIYSKVVYNSFPWFRFKQERDISGGPAVTSLGESFRRMEFFNAASADLILVTTDEEKNRLLMEQPNARAWVLPNIYEICPPKTPFSQRSGLLFIGDFHYKPDEDAVIYFATDILPRIMDKIADLVFYIAGSDMPASIESLRSCNVEPLGLVPDVVPYFESCRMFVAPLRTGATTRRMVEQSMAHGLPVVSAQIGMEDLDMENESHLLIANGADEFTDAVVRLYNDKMLWQRLSGAALDHLRDRYSYTRTQEQICNIFRSVLEEPVAREARSEDTNTSSGKMSSASLLKPHSPQYQELR